MGSKQTCIAIAGAMLLALAPVARSAPNSPPSGITGVEVSGAQLIGVFDGVAYTRTWGVVHGRVSPRETVAGLAAQPKGADGTFAYTAEFEVIAPAVGGRGAIFVEAENRGSPLLLDLLDRLAIGGKPSGATYPAGLGAGFLPNHHIAYARVQWQTGIAAGVPDQAQGVGEVITRDFGRFLAGDRKTLDAAKPAPDFGSYKVRILAGVSQSAWFVNSFIAEGFNADPVTGKSVFGGVLAIDGTGNWMTVNQLAEQHGYRQYPYLNEAGRPMTPDQLLTRPASDPVYLDVANYNDFYRVRASVSEGGGVFPKAMRRYDWPSPHAAARGSSNPRCNGGVAASLDPISYAPYARALVVGLAHTLGGGPAPALPPGALFALAPPPADPVHFNALPGVEVKVPALDADGQPMGGVRFAEIEAAFGEPGLPLPHVGLDSIQDTCGNALKWRFYSADKMARLYGSEAGYVARFGAAVDRLVAAGYLLAEDKPDMLKQAAAYYRDAPLK